MSKLTLVEAVELLENKPACGKKKTTVKIEITFNEGVTKTFTNLGVLRATTQVLAMKDCDIKTEVETEMEA